MKKLGNSGNLYVNVMSWLPIFLSFNGLVYTRPSGLQSENVRTDEQSMEKSRMRCSRVRIVVFLWRIFNCLQTTHIIYTILFGREMTNPPGFESGQHFYYRHDGEVEADLSVYNDEF